MVDFNSIRFWAKDSAGRLKGIAGSTITVALATVAQGLRKAGDIDVDAQNAGGGTTLVLRNSLGGAFTTSILGALGVLGLVGSYEGFDINDTSGTGQFRTATLTGTRTYTFPDADVTIGPSIYLGSQTKAYLNGLPASATPLTAFCTDIAGVSGGVTGVQVYWSPATVAWLRYSNDSPI